MSQRFIVPETAADARTRHAALTSCPPVHHQEGAVAACGLCQSRGENAGVPAGWSERQSPEPRPHLCSALPLRCLRICRSHLTHSLNLKRHANN